MTDDEGAGLITTIGGRKYRIDINWFVARDRVDDIADFGHWVRLRREFLNLSQHSVAAFMKSYFRIPWHQTVVAKIESGERKVKLNEALALAYIYGLTLDDLAGGFKIEDDERLVAIDEGRTDAT